MEKERYFVHFKGGLYRLLAVGQHSETLEEMVIYQALYGAQEIWVRPKAMFFDKVLYKNKKVNRFNEVTKNEMACLLVQKKPNI